MRLVTGGAPKVPSNNFLAHCLGRDGVARLRAELHGKSYGTFSVRSTAKIAQCPFLLIAIRDGRRSWPSSVAQGRGKRNKLQIAYRA